jgi:hypothetical protein
MSSEFDVRYGTATEGHDYIVTKDDASQYFSLPMCFADLILDDLRIPFETFVLVDVGSGKGRFALLASTRPFIRVIGVKIMLELHQAAVRNLDIFSRDRRHRNVEFLRVDAKTYTKIPNHENTLFFLYHPFELPTLRPVLENIRAARENTKRTLIVYCGGLGGLFDGWDDYIPELETHFTFEKARVFGLTPYLTEKDVVDIRGFAPPWQKSSRSSLARLLWKRFPEDVKRNMTDRGLQLLLKHLNAEIDSEELLALVRSQPLLDLPEARWVQRISEKRDRAHVLRLILSAAFPRALVGHITAPVATLSASPRV